MQVLMLLLFIAAPVLLSWPLGRFMTAVMNPTVDSSDGRLATLLRITGGRMLQREQDWKGLSNGLQKACGDAVSKYI